MSDARNVLDPSLLPSVLPRVQAIARLLQQIRDTADESDVPAPAEDVSFGAIESDRQPNLALGAVGDDDDWDLWIQTDHAGSSARRAPAAYTQDLAQQVTALKDSFAAARAAIDAAPGGDMSVDEQEALIRTLEAYEVRQVYV